MSKLLIIDRGLTPDLFIKTDVTPDQEAAIEFYLTGGNPLPSPTPGTFSVKIISPSGVLLRDQGVTPTGAVWSGAVVEVTGKSVDGKGFIIQGWITSDPSLVQVLP